MKREFTILIVDDEEDIRDMIEIYLMNEGFIVLKAQDGIEALEILKSHEIDLMVLDIMMPKMDGVRTCLKVREDKKLPIIMLSAKGQDSDKILGLNIGADDYVTKPFNPLELLARVNSQLRRYSKYLSMVKKDEKKTNSYVIGGLEVNSDRKEVILDGDVVKVTPIEFKILQLLIKSPGRVFSAEEIYERVWNENAVNTDTVMVHVRNIREKIEIDPKNPKYLKVVWGVGYKIEKQ